MGASLSQAERLGGTVVMPRTALPDVTIGVFQLDRVIESTVLDDGFDDEAGKTLRDLRTKIGPDAVRLLDA